MTTALATPTPVELGTAIHTAILDPNATGVYHGVPEEIYHGQIDRASSSRLKLLQDRSPAHMRWEADHPKPDTPAKKLGRAIHFAELQPKLFPETYAIAGQCEATKKGDGQRCTNGGAVRIGGHWYCNTKGHAPEGERDAGFEVLSDGDWETCVAISRAVQAHPEARALLEGPREVTALWTDPESGARCKSRFDCVLANLGTIADVKSCESAHPDDFVRTIYRFKYYRQAALYLAAAEAVGIEADAFAIIAVEKEPPHGVVVYRIEAEALKAGREELKPLLELYAKCDAEGVWPAYPTDILGISLAPYAFREIEAKRERGLLSA